jgi:hypothetical protein
VTDLKLVEAFRAAIRRLCPGRGDASVARDIGESRQNYAKNNHSTDKIRDWIRRWNALNPNTSVRLVVERDFDLSVEPKSAD